MLESDKPCPCGLEAPYSSCCQPFHRGDGWPDTPEKVMRSRYSAFAVGEVGYLLHSLDPSKRSGVDEKELQEWSRSSEWLGLQVLATEGGEDGQSEGTVEFEAHYRVKESKEEVQHREIATFRKRDGRWLFWEGKVKGNEPIQRTEPRIGRNDPCHCGSGKKFKKCCG